MFLILTLHTVSDVVVQAVLTPAVHVASAAHNVHGVLPEVEKATPAAHGPSLHTVSVVAAQAILIPVGHVKAAAAHAVQGALPEAEKVVPTIHGVSHTVSIV